MRFRDTTSNKSQQTNFRLPSPGLVAQCWCLSTPYTIKRDAVYACIHSYSARAISCRQTQPSALVRWWGDDNAHGIHSVSQQSVRRDGCVLSAPLVQHPWPADPPTFEADLQSWSVSRAKLQQHTANRMKTRLQTSRKCPFLSIPKLMLSPDTSNNSVVVLRRLVGASV